MNETNGTVTALPSAAPPPIPERIAGYRQRLDALTKHANDLQIQAATTQQELANTHGVIRELQGAIAALTEYAEPAGALPAG